MNYFKDLIEGRDPRYDAFMGSTLRKGEVVIAKMANHNAVLGESLLLVARSTTQGRIRYRLVDEYDTFFELPITSSTEPLTANEVLAMFTRCEPVAYDVELGPYFSSRFYMQLHKRAGKLGLVP